MSGAEIAAEIAEALAEVGTDTGTGPLVATITRAPIDAPVNPWDAPSTTQVSTFQTTVIRDMWRYGEIDGTLIRADDLKLMAQAGAVVPTTADTLTLDDEEYRIMSVMPEAIGGVDLYYIIQARK